jgi:hypothetical protein
MPTTSEQHPRELLPWLVNQSLNEDERVQVERHVNTCAQCQAEVQWLQAMRSGVQAQTYGGAGEMGWQRLRHGLRETRKTDRPRWVVPAALAASLVIAVQFVLLVQLQPQPTYAPLTGPAAGVPILQVEFVPEASEAALRALLRENGLRIIDGPSAAGVYRLALDPERDANTVASTLKTRSDLIRHSAWEE